MTPIEEERVREELSRIAHLMADLVQLPSMDFGGYDGAEAWEVLTARGWEVAQRTVGAAAPDDQAQLPKFFIESYDVPDVLYRLRTVGSRLERLYMEHKGAA